MGPMIPLFRKEALLEEIKSKSDVLLTQSSFAWLYWVGCAIGICIIVVASFFI